MKILIETIPHKNQRYPTVGDWQNVPGNHKYSIKYMVNGERTCEYCRGMQRENELLHPDQCPAAPITLHIKVSEMSDWRYEALVGIHEAVEALLCKRSGITEAEVDAFDLGFAHVKSPIEGASPPEPGDDPHAPYHKQHVVATQIERALSFALNVDWNLYEEEVDSL